MLIQWTEETTRLPSVELSSFVRTRLYTIPAQDNAG